MESSLHGDNVQPKDFKRFILKNKIPNDRYFDAKTRTIIKLPNTFSDGKRDRSDEESDSSLYLHQTHLLKKVCSIRLRQKFDIQKNNFL